MPLRKISMKEKVFAYIPKRGNILSKALCACLGKPLNSIYIHLVALEKEERVERVKVPGATEGHEKLAWQRKKDSQA